MISFLLQWLGLSLVILSCMSIDNLCWMTSSPEWKEKSVDIKTYLKFCCWRIWSVHKDYRDIVPAMITALCLLVLIHYSFLLGLLMIVFSYLIVIKYFWFFGRERTW